MTTPDISVLVPTYRRPALLRQCLASLRNQSLPPSSFEVVVVDDGSGDATPDELAAANRSMPNLRSVSLVSNGGPAAARNRALAEATAELVLFIDDDVVLAPDLVAVHVEIHRRLADRRVGVLGRVDWHPSLRVTPFMRWLDRSGLQFAYETWLREGPVDPPYAAFYTANLSLRRELVEEVGGFDERFPYPAWEDMELAWRLASAGFRMEYRPAARAWHARSIDLPTFRDRMAKVAESEVLLRAVQPDFPLHPSAVSGGYVRRRDRALLRAAALPARLLGRSAALDRWYEAEIAVAFAQGRTRGEAELAARTS